MGPPQYTDCSLPAPTPPGHLGGGIVVASSRSSKIWGLEKRRVGRQMTLDEWAVLGRGAGGSPPKKATPFLQDRRRIVVVSVQ